MTDLVIRELPYSEFESRIPQLNAILIDCVTGGASVSFMHPLSTDKATLFWQGVACGVEGRERVVIIAEDECQHIVGTVQLVIAQPENQPHRADVAKLLVSSSARRRGIAQKLMQYLDTVARQAKKSVLVLDTATGSAAEQLYQNSGWTQAGSIPGYALMPDGEICSTTIYYKHI